MKKFSKKDVWALAALLFGFGAIYKSVHLIPERISDDVTLPALVGASDRVIRFVTLGHPRVYENLLTIWTMQTLPTRSILAKGRKEIWRAMDQVLAKEPRNETVYLFTCMIFYHFLNAPEYCLKITGYGVRAAPQSWRIPAMQAYVFHMKLKDREHAASFYLLASEKPGCPDFYRGAGEKIRAGILDADDVRAKIYDYSETLDIMRQIENDLGVNEILRDLKGDADGQ